MPFKKRPYKKRPYKKRRKAKTTTIQRGLFSPTQIVKMRYCDHVILDPGIGNTAYDTWSATNLNDPYVAAGGHQPMGFDEYMGLYSHFMVLGAKATFYATVPSDLASDAVCLVGQLSGTTTAPGTNLNQIIEQQKSSYKFLTSRSGSRSTGHLSIYYSPKKFWGFKDLRDNTSQLRGNVSASPTENAYFQIQVAGTNPSDNPVAVAIRVVIEYSVMLSERKELGQS